MRRMAQGELSRADVISARAEFEGLARRVERLAGISGDAGVVELSPYMKSLLKMSREPEAPASATARKAANF